MWLCSKQSAAQWMWDLSLALLTYWLWGKNSFDFCLKHPPTFFISHNFKPVVGMSLPMKSNNRTYVTTDVINPEPGSNTRTRTTRNKIVVQTKHLNACIVRFNQFARIGHQFAQRARASTANLAKTPGIGRKKRPILPDFSTLWWCVDKWDLSSPLALWLRLDYAESNWVGMFTLLTTEHRFLAGLLYWTKQIMEVESYSVTVELTLIISLGMCYLDVSYAC